MRDFSVLIAVALPSSGPELLRVARLLAPVKQLRVTALHCRTELGLGSGDGGHGEGKEDWSPLDPLLRASKDVEIDPIITQTSDVEGSILSMAHERQADLVLVGWHRPVVPDGEPAGPVRGILERTDRDVAVFLARLRRPVRRCLVPFHGGRHDRRALQLAGRMAHIAGAEVTVLHIVTPGRPGDEPGTGLSQVVDDFSDGRIRLKIVENDEVVTAAIREAWAGYDLIVAGASEEWGDDFSLFSTRLQQLAFATDASLLVVHAGSEWRYDGPAPESKRSDTKAELVGKEV